MLHSFRNTGIVLCNPQKECKEKHAMHHNETSRVYFCAWRSLFLFILLLLLKTSLLKLVQVSRHVLAFLGWKGHSVNKGETVLGITDETGKAVSLNKMRLQGEGEGVEIVQSSTPQQGTLAFLPPYDIDTRTHRVKRYPRRVTQVLSKQIFRQGVGTPWYLQFLPLPASLSFVRFNAAFKGSGGRRKRKMLGVREKGGGGNDLLSQLLLRNKSHTTCKNHLLSILQRQRV